MRKEDESFMLRGEILCAESIQFSVVIECDFLSMVRLAYKGLRLMSVDTDQTGILSSLTLYK